MNCANAREWCHAYLDGELDLGRTLDYEEHMKSCSDCRSAYHENETLRESLRCPGVRFEVPIGLEERIRARLDGAVSPERKASTRTLFAWRTLAFAASLGAIVIATVLCIELLRRPSATELIAQQVVSSHVRSLLANHLTDVVSSDQHTVKPWFNGKIDFAPVFKDLTAQGFPLIGGRLDYLDNRRVAALLYKRHQHTINLFVWPSSRSEAGPETLTVNGYNVIHWTHSGLAYWAVSDLNNRELGDFVRDQR